MKEDLKSGVTIGIGMAVGLLLVPIALLIPFSFVMLVVGLLSK